MTSLHKQFTYCLFSTQSGNNELGQLACFRDKRFGCCLTSVNKITWMVFIIMNVSLPICYFLLKQHKLKTDLDSCASHIIFKFRSHTICLSTTGKTCSDICSHTVLTIFTKRELGIDQIQVISSILSKGPFAYYFPEKR